MKRHVIFSFCVVFFAILMYIGYFFIKLPAKQDTKSSSLSSQSNTSISSAEKLTTIYQSLISHARQNDYRLPQNLYAIYESGHADDLSVMVIEGSGTEAPKTVSDIKNGQTDWTYVAANLLINSRDLARRPVVYALTANGSSLITLFLDGRIAIHSKIEFAELAQEKGWLLSNPKSLASLKELNLQPVVEVCGRMGIILPSGLSDSTKQSLLKALTSYEDIDTLRVSNGETKATDSDMQIVAQIPGLSMLYIGRSPITDRGIEFLIPMNLQAIDAAHTDITDECLTSLVQFPDLRSLTIHGTKLTSRAVDDLLLLRRLSHLSLPGAILDDHGLAKLERLQALRRLVIQGTVAHGSGFESLRSLESLDVGNAPNLTDDTLRYIAKLTNLRWFSMSGVNITDDGLRHISSMPELKELEIYYGSRITDDGLSYLANLPMLERLSIYNCPNLTVDGMMHLINNSKSLRRIEGVPTELAERDIPPHITLRFGW